MPAPLAIAQQENIKKQAALQKERAMRLAAEDLVEQLRHTDIKTGLLNTQGLLSGIIGLLEKELFKARTPIVSVEERRAFFFDQQLSLAVMYIDGDGFKKINDHYGHGTGDQVIQKIAETAKVNLREDDIIFERPEHLSGELIARKGGDEFAAGFICFRGRSHEIVESTAERFRSATNQNKIWKYLVEKKPVFSCGKKPHDEATEVDSISVSIGVALISLEKLRTHRLDDVIDAADKALYASKKMGGNCTYIYDMDQDVILASKKNPIASAPEIPPIPGNPAPPPSPFPP
jgi:diguanylate cyclase (GGDEF)-like protein